MPGLAGFLRDQLTLLILALLFFAALRIDPRTIELNRATLGHDLAVAAALQVFAPAVVLAVVFVAGWTGAYATILVLIASGSPITGTPPIALMLGLSGPAALRLLVLGTLVLPVTSAVPLHLVFGPSAGLDLLEPALRLAAIIAVSVGGAALVRSGLLRRLSAEADQALGGVTAILLAVFVLALMDAIQPALLARPGEVAAALVFTCLVCFGLQVAAALTYAAVKPRSGAGYAGAIGLAAGNRNIALFLAALPAAQMDPLMVLVGCYQIPMYLTPMVMRPVYARLSAALAGEAGPR